MPGKVVYKKTPKPRFLDAITGNLGAILIGLKYFANPNRLTMKYPYEYPQLRSNYRGFIVLDMKKCIGCMSCARICPAAAMKMVKVEVEKAGKKKQMPFPVINYNRCIFCGFCVDVCPTEALYHIPVHDVVYTNMEDMVLDLEKFQEKVESPSVKEGVPVRYLFDPDKGLVKVPIKEGGGEE
ncbi:MAG: NADH-quinone oxidoreductase subunit NuoI [Desulfurococcales archaeon]|nr:NADH-quinone oxidoreductase subunit NuoI [Desulfurococcales archaeon]